MLGVHDGVAAAQLERVDGLLAPRGHLAARLVGRLALPGQVTGGEDEQVERARHEAVGQLAADDRGDAGGGFVVERLDPAHGQVGAGQHLGEAVGDALALGHQEHAPAVADAGGDLLERRVGVAAVGLDRVPGDGPADDAGLAGDGAEVDDLAVLGADHAP